MTTTEAKFDRILDLEAAVRSSRAVAAFTGAGVSDYRAGQNRSSQQADQRRLDEALSALTFDEMVAFGQYRKAVMS